VQGRDEFTPEEIAELRRLIAEKQVADRGRQKTLRARMRTIGFYITDFVTDQRGLTVSDLDELVARGVVRVRAQPTIRPANDSRRRIDSREAAMPSDEERRRAGARRRAAAEEFKPEKIDLLLVAEAPPEALDRYFYFTDVREHDSLFRYVCRAVLGREPTREGKAQLLAELRDGGVFLIDIQEEPWDESSLEELAPALVERCRKLDPEWIILIKADVFDAAYAPLARARLPVSTVRVLFPGSGQQRRFLEQFERALGERKG
jgi:hypothetical protein